MHRTLLIGLGLAILMGCSGARPVSRLSAEERAQAVAIGAEIDASVLSDGVATPVAQVRDEVVEDAAGRVPFRLYYPDSKAARRFVLFIHGGAWVGGSVAYHDNMARMLCAASGAPVLSVEYSRAPGAMFPQQFDEIRRVLDRRVAGKPELAEDAVAIVGDSAGGNMSAVLAREWRGEHGRLKLAVLINPVVDMTWAHVSDPGTLEFSRLMVKAYLPEGVEATDPRVSPLLHAVPKGHPPTFIAIGERDPWREEQELYAAKLTEAGVAVEVFRSQTGHLGPAGAQASPKAIPTLRAAGEAMKAALGR